MHPFYSFASAAIYAPFKNSANIEAHVMTEIAIPKMSLVIKTSHENQKSGASLANKTRIIKKIG